MAGLFAGMEGWRNQQYELEFAEYVRASLLYKPVVLIVWNSSASSAVVARDVRVELRLPGTSVDATDIEPEEPSKGIGGVAVGALSALPHVPDVEIQRLGNHVLITFLARKVQPGSSVASPRFYLGALQSRGIALSGQIFTDQTLPTKFEVTLALTQRL